MIRSSVKKNIGLYFICLALSAGSSAFAMPNETQIQDRDLLQSSPDTLGSKVERLQTRVDRMSAQCERFEFAFCKEVSDLKVDLRELRGEASETSSTDALKLRSLDSRLQVVEQRLGNLEEVLLAE